jgi:hypothetical protein
MLDYARQRAHEVLKIPQTAVLATNGPAGLQVSEVPCEAVDLEIYLLLPQTSDHIFNLENNENVTLLTTIWEMKGKAKVVSQDKIDPPLLRAPEREWSVLVRIVPFTIQILREGGWGNAETIDLTGSLRRL